MKADSAQILKQNHMYPARQRQYQNALRQAHWKKMHPKMDKYTKNMLFSNILTSNEDNALILV